MSESIDSLDALLFAELQELRSAELQLAAQLVGIVGIFESQPLQELLRGYAIELNSRREDLERVILAAGIDPREHSDQAMRSLLEELLKMSQIRAPNVRDAALIDSLQRIVHLKIAAYGSLATFAKALDRVGDSSRFAECAQREKSIDAQLTTIALDCVNRRARSSATGAAR
jgi:ferritin-like metal-binding protein YciE